MYFTRIFWNSSVLNVYYPNMISIPRSISQALAPVCSPDWGSAFIDSNAMNISRFLWDFNRVVNAHHEEADMLKNMGNREILITFPHHLQKYWDPPWDLLILNRHLISHGYPVFTLLNACVDTIQWQALCWVTQWIRPTKFSACGASI